jgi:hypothetical protein
MAKSDLKPKPGPGRPKLYHIKRCIGFSEADHIALTLLGDGSITSGVRRALSLLRASGVIK